jgi:hypothetical protein
MRIPLTDAAVRRAVVAVPAGLEVSSARVANTLQCSPLFACSRKTLAFKGMDESEGGRT